MSSKVENSDSPLPDFERLPRHVAIIMDGNGRWAKKKLMNRVKGHEQGAETVRMVVRTTRELGVPFLTLYAFSTENWQRPKAEVMALMTLLKRFLVNEKKEMLENDIRLNVIGQTERLPDDVKAAMNHTMEATAQGRKMTLTLALSYGGREELVRAFRKMAHRVADHTLDPELIDESVISQHLYTATMPDPDLMIRTSGEVRISNFLLWQLAYAEMAFTPKLWPDFSKEDYIQILKDFGDRERRFGKTGDQLE
ncbi:Undecaprenyl pyrophosphate synthetase [Desulfatibacillum alkenivorans DSM 16219]|uniref:Isoprenyl transferase n=1 Tax=Desulfatibacillum alkenivorans DSM 16219 TaxID=1121393 RepID=A0A1M6DXX3_9BACT|nr:isoprenyl transferase [Desulfatibacillum alkenivorans]SHI78096.1 Undecaprenyl pyrophosphate synthetase [Desulfatibacillum alkenivorans DSM 16219]